MLTALLVGLLASRGDQGISEEDRLLTYDNPGAPVERVLQDLSGRSRIHLEVSPAAKGDILVVHLQKATLRESMDRIAWAVGGSWEKVGDTYWLKRTSRDLREEAQREKAYDIEFGRAIIAQWQKDSREPEPMTEAKATLMAKAAKEAVRKFNPSESTIEYTKFATQLTGDLPLMRVLHQVVRAMPPEELGQLPGGIEVVYSTAPNANQRPFPIDAKPLISRLQAEQQTWLDAITRYSVSGPQVDGVSFQMEGVSDASGFENLGKILVGFQRRSAKFPAISVRVQAWSRSGRSLGQISRYVYGRAPTAEPPKLKNPTAFPATFAQKAISRRNRASMSGADTPLEPSVVRQLVAAEGPDPLAVTTGESLVTLATLQSKNLVGCLDDSSLFAVVPVDKKGMVVPVQLLSGMVQEHEITSDAKWLSFRPLQPSAVREFRTHRPTLSRYLARVSTGESLGLEERASWAKALPSMEDSFLPVVLARLVAPPSTALPISDDGPILRLYGSLDPGQRRRAKSNDGLPLAMLTEPQLGLVRKLFFGERRLRTYLEMNPGGPVVTDMLDIRNEATEIVGPNWLQAGILRLSQQSEDAVLVPGRRGETMTVPDEVLSAKELGWQVFHDKNPQLFGNESGTNATRFERLQVGRRTTVGLQIQLSPITRVDGSLKGWDPTDRRWASYKQLPNEFRQQVEFAEGEYLRMHANRNFGSNGTPPTQNPPPPIR